MGKKTLPLEEVSIERLYMAGDHCVFEVPVYQRNYAWEKDEISMLIQDICDSYEKDPKSTYYIGTLVSFHKGDNIFEIIDGQQRLTTIYLILRALGENPQNKLTYKARKKSDLTLKSIPEFDIEEYDRGIVNGYQYAKTEIENVDSDKIQKEVFKDYFLKNVHIIHYRVPKDIDLNHYFEVMNSRGEQLEKHEIVKAYLMQQLSEEERHVFSRIWEACSDMSIYVQQNFKSEKVFGSELRTFLSKDFDDLLKCISSENLETKQEFLTIADILSPENYNLEKIKEEEDKKDTFQPIIDFPNFLLIVLKLSCLIENGVISDKFALDDKELLNEFYAEKFDVKKFAYNLLKARFYLDNYIVHHTKEDDRPDNNPWKLQTWGKDSGKNTYSLKNLSSDDEERNLQSKLVQLLSMFEVSFTARQRKNYLFYCLMYLFNGPNSDLSQYAQFLEDLADRYFYNIYLEPDKLNSKNIPNPGAFDEVILSEDHKLSIAPVIKRDKENFIDIYGDGSVASSGIALFVFNYMDYQIWKCYAKEKGHLSEGSIERKHLFEKLGCSDFDIKYFRQFYFSRTRRSLEHYYAQALATGNDDRLNQDQINCFGNYAMIGSSANSSGSNWQPITKIEHYLDTSKKINPVSVSSLKFLIMMQVCKDHGQWKFKEIQEHQHKMIDILFLETEE